eukprot:scaffold4854_cov131-Isochrysis_galbana.AAC.9
MDMPAMAPPSPVSTAEEQTAKAMYGAKTTTRPATSRPTADLIFDLVLAGFPSSMYSVPVMPSKSAMSAQSLRSEGYKPDQDMVANP